VHKLNILDAVDEQSGSGKLDLIIQLPYPTKSTERQKLAEKRRQNIDDQLNGSKYGVAYIDATEKVTQLNRPVENNLMKQVEVLTETLYSQLGMTTSIFDGTATPEVMTNYFTRTVEVMLSVIVLEFRRKYLSKEARAQGHSIMYLRDPFKFASVKDLAELADKFGRNIIVTPNEFRRKALHMRPSKDPEADKLKNRNIAEAKEPQSQDRPPTMEKIKEQEADNQNGGTI
jgi:hypothetical protein